MTVRDLFAGDLKLLASAKASKNAATTTNFDFGTPDDVNLAALTNYKHNDKILVVFTATTVGTTDTITFGVSDAPDSSGSIGTPVAAATDGTLAGGTGDAFLWTAVQLKAGRPWLRCTLTGVGTTDTFACTCLVFAVGSQV